MTGDLTLRWRQEADLYRRDGVEALARMAERHATELEVALAAGGEELLSAGEAAHASGYTSDHLRRLVDAGRLRNYGRPHVPRYRRAELPSKPGRILPDRLPHLHPRGATPRDLARDVAHRSDEG